MDLFTYIISQSLVLYHGSNTPITKLRNEPIWLSLNKKTAKKYGKIVYEICLKKDIKLINIQSGIFQMHLMDQLNVKYPILDNGKYINTYKSSVMSTLGLPNTDEIIRVFGKPTCKYDDVDMVNMIEVNRQYFAHERWSKEKDDRLLMGELDDIYSKYGFDGYFSPVAVPSRFHCGWFNDEVALFRPKSVIISGVTDGFAQIQIGGSIKPFVYDPNNDAKICYRNNK